MLFSSTSRGAMNDLSSQLAKEFPQRGRPMTLGPTSGAAKNDEKHVDLRWESMG